MRRWSRGLDVDAGGEGGYDSAGGDIAYVRVDPAAMPDGTLHVKLEQDTGAQASMMAVDNANGEVLAMVGGRDFALSQFNRATQAQRQVGSSFKPYVYTAAVEAGTKPTDTIVDAPVSFPTPNGPYTPHNYEPDYKGTMSILAAFEESRNIPALKLAAKVGITKVIEVAHGLGSRAISRRFCRLRLGRPTLRCSSRWGLTRVSERWGSDPAALHPQGDAGGWAATGGQASEVKEVISVETARTMMTLLQGVVKAGTGAAASSLKHPLGGKTGTTNDYTDAWFVGFPVDYVRDLDRVRRPAEPGQEGDGREGGAADVDGLHEGGDCDKPNEAFPSATAPKKVLEVPMNEAPAAPAKPADTMWIRMRMPGGCA